jgi:hypothetical protein
MQFFSALRSAGMRRTLDFPLVFCSISALVLLASFSSLGWYTIELKNWAISAEIPNIEIVRLTYLLPQEQKEWLMHDRCQNRRQ